MNPPAVRPAAVAGSFYPADAATLSRDLSAYLARAVPPIPLSHPLSRNGRGIEGEVWPAIVQAPKALIVPHAGYIYSGPVAGTAYSLLAPARGRIRRVVLLGPCHRVALDGIAVPSVDAFATPLGDVPLDRVAIESLRDLPQVVPHDQAHAAEHSLEVHLPFLQQVLGDFELVPLAVGRTGAGEVAAVIDRLWGGSETLIVISTDLSHFHPYAEAQAMDDVTVRRIAALEPLTSFDQACGALPVNGMVEVARRRDLRIALLDHRNSGDTAGDKARVVGYASFALYGPEAGDDDALGQALLSRARNAIAGHFGLPRSDEPVVAGLSAPGATFVTLTQAGQLRGCIGSLEAHRPLEADVRANALAAALRDPRFPPLTAAELPRTRIEISLLTAPEPMRFTDEADALTQLRPDIDGVIFIAGSRRSTFLPQVWEQLPDPRDFLGRLKQKAGLPADYWSPEVRLERYAVRKWKAPSPD